LHIDVASEDLMTSTAPDQAAIDRQQHEGVLRAEPLAWAAVAGIVVYVLIDVLLKFLRPDYSLLYNAESDYGRGPWFWVMDLNFLLRCALSLAAIVAIARGARLDGRVRTGLTFLIIWAVCSGLLAFFADDIEGTRQHGSGVVHLILAFIAFACVAVGTIVTSIGLRGSPAWRPVSSLLLIVSIAGAAAFLLLGHAAGHPHAPGGLYERIFLGLELLWLALAVLPVLRKGSSPPAS
jgi:hypothetical membrane protein